MFLSRWVSRIKDPRGVRHRWLRRPSELRRMLLSERARSVRTGRPFTLIRITPMVGRLTSGQVRQFEKVLRSRLRSYDQAGIHDEGAFVVLLPETDRDGGLKVAADIQIRLGDDAEDFRWQVAQYPSSEESLHDDSGDQGGAIDDRRQPAASEESRPAHPVEIMLSRSLPAWKRGMDVALSAVGLTFAAPVIGLAALAIKATSPGPVIFKQRRTGVGGKPFVMHKLRTMSAGAEQLQKSLRHLNEQDGPAFKIENDPRITTIGRVLRSSCVDELPQLWNVLRGEMSIVGPRPLPCHESDACRGWRRARLDITPGLTCIWQVKGRSKVSFDEWMRMDLEYAKRQSFLLDVCLMFGTVGLVAKSVLPRRRDSEASPASPIETAH
jgi:lipopolysaccharide/colanic/teichoic acid biosynthesis glycosyltransferase